MSRVFGVSSPEISPRETLTVVGASGNRIACRLWGQEHGPTVVLSSGIGCGPVFFRSIISALAPRYRIVYWDYRGHGKSQYVSGKRAYRIQKHTRDLDHVLRTVAPDGPLFLVGFSMGVQVHLEWMRLHSSRVAALVFLLGAAQNPLRRVPIFRSAGARIISQLARAGRPLLQLTHPVFQRLWRTRLTYELARRHGFIRNDCPEADFMEFVHFATDVAPDAYLRCAAGLMRHDASDLLGSINKPVLIVAADSDVLVLERDTAALAAAVPHCQYEVIRGGSHATTLERSRYVAACVLRFLDSVVDGFQNV